MTQEWKCAVLKSISYRKLTILKCTSARPDIANTHDDVPHELDLNVSKLGAVADMDFEAMFSPDSMILVSFPIEESMTNEPEYCWSLETVTDLLSS